MLKEILLVGGGAGIGYLIARHVYNNAIRVLEEELEQAFEEINDFIHDTAEDVDAVNEKFTERKTSKSSIVPVSPDEGKKHIVDYTQYANAAKDALLQSAKIQNLQTVHTRQEMVAGDIACAFCGGFDCDCKLSAGTDGSAHVPYLIDIDDWQDDSGEYEKVSLYYYQTDGILATEGDENITDNSLKIIGEDAIRLLTEGMSYIWVRDDGLEKDYEIAGLTGSYIDAIVRPSMSPSEAYKERTLNEKEE